MLKFGVNYKLFKSIIISIKQSYDTNYSYTITIFKIELIIIKIASIKLINYFIKSIINCADRTIDIKEIG